MVLAGDSKGSPAARRSALLALGLAGVLGLIAGLIAAGAPAASASPAQEEYKLNIPSPKGGTGNGGGSSSSPEQIRSQLSRGALSPGSAAAGGFGGSGGTSVPYSSTLGGSTGPYSAGDSNGSDSNGDALLARARERGDSGLLSAGTSAAGKTPLGLAVVAALLAIGLAGLLAARRSRRAGAATSD